MEDNFDNFDFSSLTFDTPAQPAASAQPAAPAQQAPVSQPVAQPTSVQQPVAQPQQAPVASQPVNQPVYQPAASAQPAAPAQQAPVDLDKAAAEAENFTLSEIALGTSVSSNIVEPYKPVAGVLSRIAFISDRPQPLKTHYLAKEVPSLGKRSILCKECSCCTMGNPSVYYLFPIIEYPSILGSKPLQPDTSRQPVLKVLKCGKKLYDSIVNLYEQTGSILGMDFGLSNTSQGEWVQTSIMAIPGNWQSQFPGSLESLTKKWETVKGKAWTAFAAYKTAEEIDQAIRMNSYTPPAQPEFNSDMLGF